MEKPTAAMRMNVQGAEKAAKSLLRSSSVRELILRGGLSALSQLYLSANENVFGPEETGLR